MTEETVVFFLFTFVIAGGVIVIVTSMRHHARVLEMAHRERLMMIERGMAPSVERLGVPFDAGYQDRRAVRSNRMLSGGIVVVGLGLAIATLIGFASRETNIAFGVGGAITVLGAAFIVTALLVHGPAKVDVLSEPRRNGDRSGFPPTSPLP